MNFFSKSSKGFTLIELIVVMGVLAVAGIILTETFFRSLSGSNKAEVLSKIKQNGQIAMDAMDKTIRNAEAVVCPSSTGITEGAFTEGSEVLVVLNSDGSYTRFRFFNQPSNLLENGRIEQDTVTYSTTICDVSDIDPDSSPILLTDSNTKSGASLVSGNFKRNKKSGFKDVVAIEFRLGPGVETPKGIISAIDPVVFQTTVQLR